LEEREQALAILRVCEQARQRLERALGFVAHDDVLLATNAPLLVARLFGQKLAVVLDQLVPQMQPVERHRLALACKQRSDPRDRLGISTGPDRGERVSYDRKLARLDCLRAFACPGLVGHVERKQVAVELEERR